MAKPRLNQFAEDLGVSRGKAQSLMKKARTRRDGGASIINKYSRTQDAYRIFREDTEIGTSAEKGRKKMDKRQKEQIEENPRLLDPNHPMNREGSPKKEKETPKKKKPEVYAASGKYMSCNGYGKAIQGTKFTGVK